MSANSNMNVSTDISSTPDDIQHLLHLETIKRFTEETKKVQRQVEEHARTYIDAKREYQREFANLAKLTKNVKLCASLASPNVLIKDNHVSRTCVQLTEMCDKISNDKRPMDLDLRTLDEFKMHLEEEHRPRTKLAKQQEDFAKNRQLLNSLRSVLDIAEKGFEMTTLASIHQLTIDLQPPTAQGESPKQNTGPSRT